MVSYAKEVLLSLRFWWKPSGTWPSPLKPLSPSTWSTIRNFGILKSLRGKKAGLRGRNNSDKLPSTSRDSVLSESILSASPIHGTSDLERSSTVISNNRLSISTISSCHKQQKGKYDLPNFFYTNSRSIISKIDELCEIIKHFATNFICITESWLSEDIPDNCIMVDGFNIYRCDREQRKGGGICAWVKSDIQCSELCQYQCDDYESLWLKSRPCKLPRGVSSLLTGIIYRPNNTKDANVLEHHIIDVCDGYLNSHPDAGIVILGDFNRMNTKPIERKLGVKQIVNFPTRGEATLDLILTNVQEYYCDPTQLPPLGRSDHSAILYKPKQFTAPKGVQKVIHKRKLNNSNLTKLYDHLKRQNWIDVYLCNSVEEKTTLFYDKVTSILDQTVPIKPYRINTNDKPWMTSNIKSLIVKRQRAWKSGNIELRNFYRNRVVKEIKCATGTYYKNNLEDTKSGNPRKWWKGVKAITRQKTNTIPSRLTFGTRDVSGIELAEMINSTFLKVVEEYDPLETDHNPAEFAVPEDFLLTTEKVSEMLSSLNSKKSCGPEPIPTVILKEMSSLLAPPLTHIFNSALIEGHFPAQWKRADVCPVPKKSRVQDPEKDLRPISLTSPVGKVYERHLNSLLIKQIGSSLDEHHFGCVKGSSTTCALVSLMNFLLSSTDDPNDIVRLCFYDLSKGFDRVDHHILIDTVHQFGVHPVLVQSIRSFLTGRFQRVRIDGISSEWRPVPAGIPQGSVLGPTLFLLMVNSLALRERWRWKYMDDITIGETIRADANVASSLQESSDDICREVHERRMQLNPIKCKEMLISFKRKTPVINNITINNTPIERVTSYKLLGLIVSSNLKWNDHIESLSKKASKRIYSVRLLKRASVAEQDLVTFYTTCIRSVLEYACPAWFYSTPKYLLEQLESIQRRTMRVIYPDCSYREACLQAEIPQVKERLEDLCKSFFMSMQDRHHKLYGLLPDLYTNPYTTRSVAEGKKFKIPVFKTNRAMNNFIFQAARAWNSSSREH